MTSVATATLPAPLRILMWHLHGSYATSMVHGRHTYLIPTLPARGPYGIGRADSWAWPDNAVEIAPGECADTEVDVVVLQRPEELHLAEAWLGGRRPGIDLPAVYLEHNAPQGRINDLRHPMADLHDERPRLLIVHVTHFNRLFWDAGDTPARVVEHGVLDPGYLYDGSLERAAVAINEPVRRARVTGTDLLQPLSEASGVAIDLFGIKTEEIGGRNIPQLDLHMEMAQRRVYLHPLRWTSLGLTLLEAMHIGMPVVALATTEAVEAIPAEAGVVSNDPAKLAAALRRFVNDAEDAAVCGKAARAAAIARYGIDRFLSEWETLFREVCG